MRNDMEDIRTTFQKEALDSIPPGVGGRLELAPRFGKTKLIIDLIKRDNPNTVLWVSVSKKLLKEDLPEEFKKWDAEAYLDRLETSTWRSLHKVKGHYDLIVLDEDQSITRKSSEPLITGKLKGRIITMTGTPSKNFNKNYVYTRLGLKYLYKMDIKRAVEEKCLIDYRIYVKPVPFNNVSEKMSYRNLTEHLNIAIANRESNKIKMVAIKRMKVLQESTDKLKATKSLLKVLKGKTLIFAPNIKKSKEVCENTYHSMNTPSYNKEILEKFNSGDIKSLAMVKSGSIGYTFKNIDNIVIMQCENNTNGLVTQRICRALLKQETMKTPKIYVLVVKGTVDEKWAVKSLSPFNKDRIELIKKPSLKFST